MVSDRELIDIVIRLLNGHGDKRDIEQLHKWKQTSFDRNVNQQAKYIINIGEAEGIKIGDSLNTELLEEIRDLLRSQSVTPDLDIDWQEMSQVMLEEYQKLTTNPLTAGEGVFHSSDRVYVPLGLVERKRKARHTENISPEKGSELYQETEITQRFENEEFLEQIIKLGQSPKSQGKRIAIIGEPGAGKTTLLQQIAQWITKQVENSIVVWVSLADLRGEEIEIYILERWLQAVGRWLGHAEVPPQAKNAFVKEFQNGRVWLLLDGVDEMQVTSVNPLSEISQQVRTGGLLSQAKIVLTCRVNLWDGNVNALDTFDTYRTLDFSYPQQVEQFISNWFSCLSSGEEQTGQNLCTALKEQGKERIRDLVKNPLRLTLLCFNWHLGNGKLPETKAGLYEQFVDDFYEWKREQFTTTGKQRKQLNTALGELAREAIDKDKARFRLRQDFVCVYLGEPDDEDSLFSLALRLGWLNKVGVDGDNLRKGVYAFFHPTFQEYFAALAVNNWDFFVPKIHIKCPIDCNYQDNRYRIFQLQWKEIILLWLGRNAVSKEEKESFLTKLLEFDDGCDYALADEIEKNEGFYERRAYLLALEGANEYQESSQLEPILEKIIVWAFGYFDKNSGQWFRQLKSVEDMSMAMLLQFDGKKVEPALVNLIKNTPQNTIIHSKAVEILKKIAPNNPESTSSLVDLMNRIDKPLINQEIRNKGIEVTVRIPTPLQKFTNNQADLKLDIKGSPHLKLNGIFATNELNKICLENLCKYSNDEGLRLLAAEYLSRIDLTSNTAKTTLQDLTKNSGSDKQVKIFALSLLIHRGLYRLASLLLQEYHNSLDHYIRKYTDRILHRINRKILEKSKFKSIPQPTLTSVDINSISIEEKLLEIENASDKRERISLMDSLLEIDPNNIQAIDSLIGIVQNSKIDSDLRFKATITLRERIVLGNQPTIDRLESLLKNVGLTSPLDFRYSHPNLLAEFNQGDTKLVTIIVILWKIDPKNSKVITALQNLIKYSWNDYGKREAAKILEKIDIGNFVAMDTLDGVERSFFDDSYSLDVINILLKLDSTRLKAIEALIKLIKTTQNINDEIVALEKIQSLLTNEHMPKVITYLKPYLSNLVCNDNERLLKDAKYINLLERYYELFILCSQNLTYPEFYKAWNEQLT